MIHLENIKSSGYFTELHLNSWEILFHEWDVDEYLYIVYDWELAVEKSITTKKWDFKTLWLLWVGNIVGEASLSHKEPKEVQIIANRDTILLKINGKKDFKNFVRDFPNDWYELLTTIIDISNTRLLRANRELTANYEVNIAISKIKDISMTSIYKLLLIFESILWVDQIMYYEKNLVVEHYYKLKYDSKNKKSLQNTILKFTSWEFDRDVALSENIKLSKFIRSTKLSLWEENYGFLVIWKDNKDFSENEEKLLANTASSFVWIIHQKKILDEQRNMKYVKSAL